MCERGDLGRTAPTLGEIEPRAGRQPWQRRVDGGHVSRDQIERTGSEGRTVLSPPQWPPTHDSIAACGSCPCAAGAAWRRAGRQAPGDQLPSVVRLCLASTSFGSIASARVKHSAASVRRFIFHRQTPRLFQTCASAGVISLA